MIPDNQTHKGAITQLLGHVICVLRFEFAHRLQTCDIWAVRHTIAAITYIYRVAFRVGTHDNIYLFWWRADPSPLAVRSAHTTEMYATEMYATEMRVRETFTFYSQCWCCSWHRRFALFVHKLPPTQRKLNFALKNN